ncbi:MAG: DEAD/DEAH box helicase family protein [Myxococcota bacterium]
MRLRFDPHQPHQLEAIRAVVDVLEGQPRRPTGLEAPRDADGGVVQGLDLPPGRLLDNLRAVQRRHGLPESPDLGEGLHLSVEMETGTGKTYTYLRTLRELHARYGLSRFVVVVPGVAIREGVLQQIRATGAHLDALYDTGRCEARVHRPGALSALRRFARDDGLQVLVLNIEAFDKGRRNLLHRPADALGGRRPMDVLAGTRPVVILDEPHRMAGPKAREAIASLEPLCTVGWSATHRRLHHLVYRLDPVRAYDLGLVKRIEVASVTAEGTGGPPPMEVRSIRATSRGVSARLALEVSGRAGPRRKVVTVRGEGEDLQELSGGREIYSGWVVEHVDAARGRVVFAHGEALHEGARAGVEARAAVMRRQLEETVREHLERERSVRRLRPGGQRMKVLSLCFVDRVAHYADEDGPIRRWFEETWTRLSAEPRYADLDLPPVDRVHAGYFAERAGRAVDTGGRSKDDDAAYALIMRDKERLLSPDEPVRFVFSHSALREGWDNPNVFQICTLHVTRSEIRKRQELGRGLRLPVLEDGRRTADPDVARLVVVANESYDDFARRLQQEIREETGADFAGRVVDRRARRAVGLREGWREDPDLLRLWEVVARPVRHRADLDGDRLRRRCVEALRALPAPAVEARVRVRRGEVGIDGAGEATRDRVHAAATGRGTSDLPDPLAHLQRETGLTRRTLARVLGEAGLLDDLLRDPVGVLERAADALARVVREEAADRGTWEPSGAAPSPETFEDRPLAAGRREVVPVSKALHVGVPVRSEAEARWVRALDEDPSVRRFLRWPGWMPVETPLGRVDPGWAVLREEGAVEVVRASRDAMGDLQRRCLERRFAAIDVAFCTAVVR